MTLEEALDALNLDARMGTLTVRGRYHGYWAGINNSKGEDTAEAYGSTVAESLVNLASLLEGGDAE